MPLHVAAREGSLEIVKFYIYNQRVGSQILINLDAKMYDGWTPFLYAAVNGYPSIVELLATPQTYSHMTEAALCDVNVSDKYNRNALHWIVI